MQTNMVSSNYAVSYPYGTTFSKETTGGNFVGTLQKTEANAPTMQSSGGLTLRYRKDYVAEDDRKIDAGAVDPTNCGMVDLFVKMKHLVRNGSIDQETMNRELVLAHVYMQYRTPDANENTNINWVSWYEKQLELEMNNAGRNQHTDRLKNLLEYLSVA